MDKCTLSYVNTVEVLPNVDSNDKRVTLVYLDRNAPEGLPTEFDKSTFASLVGGTVVFLK